MSKPGVFCLEGDWSDHLADKSSVRPLLEVLEPMAKVPFIHRDVGTPAELEHYLRKWTQKRYANYFLAYLAFHGTPGNLAVGRHDVSLADLEAVLAGRCDGRVVYFAGCSILDIDQGEIDGFRKATGARAVCGYVKDVDWLVAAAFELLLIEALTYYARTDAAFKFMNREYAGLVDKLGFRSSWRRRS